MDRSSVEILSKRYAWVANILQSQAYEQQYDKRGKPLKQFIPCQKGLVFTAYMWEKCEVTMIVIPNAAITQCECHHNLSEIDLWILYSQSEKEYPNSLPAGQGRQKKENKMNTDEMLEQLGSAATEEMVHQTYDGKSMAFILADLDEMFPGENNRELAEEIFRFCN